MKLYLDTDEIEKEVSGLDDNDKQLVKKQCLEDISKSAETLGGEDYYTNSISSFVTGLSKNTDTIRAIHKTMLIDQCKSIYSGFTIDALEKKNKGKESVSSTTSQICDMLYKLVKLLKLG